MSIYFKAPTQNFVSTTLNGSINDAVDAITLNDASKLSYPGYVVIDREDGNGTATPNAREVVYYTGISGNQLTGCTRGADSSTARSHNDGALVEVTFTIGMWNNLVDILKTFVSETDGATRVQQDWVTDDDGATVTFDLSEGNKHVVVLGGNRTLALSNVQSGHVFIIKLTQDGTGSRTVTWFSTISWPDGLGPTLTTTADKSDVFGFIQTGEDTYDGFIIGQNL